MKRSATQAFPSSPESTRTWVDLSNSPPLSPTDVTSEIGDSPSRDLFVGALLCCVTGKPIAKFKHSYSTITLTDVLGQPLELNVRIENLERGPRDQTLVITQRWSGHDASKAEAHGRSEIQYELKKRVDDLKAIGERAVSKFNEIAARIAVERRDQDELDVMAYLDDEEYRALMGVRLQHKSRIIQIEETETLIKYLSWSTVGVELVAGTRYKLPGLCESVVVCARSMLVTH